MRLFAALALVLGLAASSHGKTLKVPSKFATIDDAVAAAQPGDTIRIAPGVYEDGIQGFGLTNVTIRGGKGVHVRTTLANAIVSLAACTDVRLIGLTLEGAATMSLEANGCVGLRIEDCRVVGAVGEQPNSMLILGGSNVRLTNVEFRGLTGASLCAAIGGFMSPVAGVRVTKCRVVDCSRGIAITGDDVRVTKCRFSGSALFQLLVNSSSLTSPLTIAKNRFTDSEGVSVEVDGLHDARIVGNSFARVLAAVQVAAAHTTVIRGNRIVDSSQLGINVFSSGIEVTDNELVRPGDVGIRVSNATVLLARNTIDKANGSGIVVSANDCILRSNHVRRAGVNGIEVLGSGNELKRNSSRDAATFDLRCDLDTNDVAKSNKFRTVQDIL